MLKMKDDSLEGKTVTVSGSGNVAQFACEKLIDLGAKPLTLSDSGGFIYDPDGITQEKLEYKVEVVKGWGGYNRITIFCKVKDEYKV